MPARDFRFYCLVLKWKQVYLPDRYEHLRWWDEGVRWTGRRNGLNDDHDHSETFNHNKWAQRRSRMYRKMTVRSTFGPFDSRADIWNAINGNREINGMSAVCKTSQFTRSNEWIPGSKPFYMRRNSMEFILFPAITIKIEIAHHMSSPSCYAFVHSMSKQFRIEYQLKCLMSIECYGSICSYSVSLMRYNPMNINFDFRLRIAIVRQHSHPAGSQTHRSEWHNLKFNDETILP